VSPWLHVVGLGDDGLAGLTAAARALVERAELLVGGARHLALAAGSGAELLAWESPLSRTVERIAERRGRPVVVLGSGDPLWYGIGVTLARRFPAEEIRVLPHVGAFSLAAARMLWPLAECETLTLHGRPAERVLLHVAPGARLLILSADGTTPARVAELLVRSGWGASELTVLEHLDGPREARLDAVAKDWAEERCADLNTIAVHCRATSGARILARTPGLPDEAFEHDGQITKREIRAATVAALAPMPGEALWDVGAGCGSVAIEWLRAARGTRAHAVERSGERCRMIAVNAAELGVPELNIVEGAAPAALDGLPPPDAVFVGGGVSVPRVLDAAWAALRPGGRLVANAVTLEGEAALLARHTRAGGTLTRIAVSRAAPIGGRTGWRPLMPVTQYAAVKPCG
jgi:precorrin-6Y C5,15-methyltransferase (decarboxylating)